MGGGGAEKRSGFAGWLFRVRNCLGIGEEILCKPCPQMTGKCIQVLGERGCLVCLGN